MRKQSERKPLKAAAAALSYILAGTIFWLAARLFSALLRPLSAILPPLADIAVKAALEETLRFSIAIVSAALTFRFGWNRKILLYSVIASTAFAVLENAAYVLAFPFSDIYIRAGYSSLIHANNAAIMALAILVSTEKTAKTALRVGLSFLFCLSWHFALNALAASRFIDVFALPAVIANFAILIGLFFGFEIIHFHKEEIHERN